MCNAASEADIEYLISIEEEYEMNRPFEDLEMCVETAELEGTDINVDDELLYAERKKNRAAIRRFRNSNQENE